MALRQRRRPPFTGTLAAPVGRIQPVAGAGAAATFAIPRNQPVLGAAGRYWQLGQLARYNAHGYGAGDHEEMDVLGLLAWLFASLSLI